APAVAIRQKNTTRSPRSTVGTATEIYDYLRLLFARVGRTYCLNCGSEVRKDTVDEITDAVLGLGEGTRLSVLFPVVAPGAILNPVNGKKAAVAKRKSASSAPQSDASTDPSSSPGMTRAASKGKKVRTAAAHAGASLDGIKGRLFEL